MNDAGASRELIIVLVTMAAFFLFGLVGVIIFIRTWRKEKAGGGRRAADSQNSKQ